MKGTNILYRPPCPYMRQAIRRQLDCWGRGEFKAFRGKRNGIPKFHNGIDFLIEPGSMVYSAASGTVTKLGTCYRGDDYRYVQVTDDLANHVRHFYVRPRVHLGDVIRRGDAIGYLQALSTRYPKDEDHPVDMPDHLHLEIMQGASLDGRRHYIDPDEYEFE